MEIVNYTPSALELNWQLNYTLFGIELSKRPDDHKTHVRMYAVDLYPYDRRQRPAVMIYHCDCVVGSTIPVDLEYHSHLSWEKPGIDYTVGDLHLLAPSRSHVVRGWITPDEAIRAGVSLREPRSNAEALVLEAIATFNTISTLPFEDARGLFEDAYVFSVRPPMLREVDGRTDLERLMIWI